MDIVDQLCTVFSRGEGEKRGWFQSRPGECLAPHPGCHPTRPTSPPDWQVCSKEMTSLDRDALSQPPAATFPVFAHLLSPHASLHLEPRRFPQTQTLLGCSVPVLADGWEERDAGTTGALAEGTKGQGRGHGWRRGSGAASRGGLGKERRMLLLLPRSNNRAGSPRPSPPGAHGRGRAGRWERGRGRGRGRGRAGGGASRAWLGRGWGRGVAGGSALSRQAAPLLRAGRAGRRRGPAAAHRRWHPAPRSSRGGTSSPTQLTGYDIQPHAAQGRWDAAPRRLACGVPGTDHPPRGSGEGKGWICHGVGGKKDLPCKGPKENLSDGANCSSAEDWYVF